MARPRVSPSAIRRTGSDAEKGRMIHAKPRRREEERRDSRRGAETQRCPQAGQGQRLLHTPFSFLPGEARQRKSGDRKRAPAAHGFPSASSRAKPAQASAAASAPPPRKILAALEFFDPPPGAGGIHNRSGAGQKPSARRSTSASLRLCVSPSSFFFASSRRSLSSGSPTCPPELRSSVGGRRYPWACKNLPFSSSPRLRVKNPSFP